MQWMLLDVTNRARLRQNEAALRERGVVHAALFGSRARGDSYAVVAPNGASCVSSPEGAVQTQGNALGNAVQVPLSPGREFQCQSAIAGCINAPFQGLDSVCDATQGVALG
jgi:hypothetical protein